jgi:hypothetical protein
MEGNSLTNSLLQHALGNHKAALEALEGADTTQ